MFALMNIYNDTQFSCCLDMYTYINFHIHTITMQEMKIKLRGKKMNERPEERETQQLNEAILPTILA